MENKQQMEISLLKKKDEPAQITAPSNGKITESANVFGKHGTF
jgi:hypothetical protein